MSKSDKAMVASKCLGLHLPFRLQTAFIRNARGVVAVEFAIVLPVLIMIMVGALVFGRALEERNQMSHALSQAVRVVNLDSEQTPATIATLMGTYLDDFDSDDLTITTSATTVSDVDYIDISVSFPFDASIPFVTIGEVTLDVATRVPVISSTQ